MSPTDVDAGAAGERQVGLNVDASAPTLGEAAVGRHRRRHDAASPHHAAGGDDRAVREERVTGRDLLDPGAEVDLDSLVFEHLGDVAVGLVGERLQQRVAVVEQVDVSLARIEVAVLGGDGHLDHVGQRAGDLDAGRTAADDHEVERAALARAPGRGRRASNRPRIRERSRVASSSEYSGNEFSAAPGVWKKFGCEPAARTSASPLHVSPSCVRHGPRCRVHAGDLGELDVYVVPGPANTSRNEWAMSLGASCEVATWYSSGWNWW